MLKPVLLDFECQLLCELIDINTKFVSNDLLPNNYMYPMCSNYVYIHEHKPYLLIQGCTNNLGL